MNLCVFQGTFNPIHNAHLRVAEFVIKNFNIDKIIFIPAFEPPHKTFDPQMAQHRFNMVKLAIENNPQFDISDIEYRRKGKSYTILTIEELYETFKIDSKIHFIIGTDAFDKIESWYQADELKKLVKFIVFVRENNFNDKKYDYLKEKGYDFELQQLSYENISSSTIRQLIKQKENTNKYLPKSVEEYIKKNGLYKN